MAKQILPPQREITEEMLNTAARKTADGFADTYNIERKYYQDALDGDCSSQFNIGLNWSLGYYGEKDKDEALRWYYLAAQQGDAEAERCVAEAYDMPNAFGPYNLQENDFEAAKWYARAAAHGDKRAASDLSRLVRYNDITKEELRIANELAYGDKKAASTANQSVTAGAEAEKKHEKFYGTWTSARGATFSITPGPYLNLSGAGKFSGEWTSDGELYVSFGYPDEIHLRYYNGYLYDRNGRMHWRIGD